MPFKSGTHTLICAGSSVENISRVFVAACYGGSNVRSSFGGLGCGSDIYSLLPEKYSVFPSALDPSLVLQHHDQLAL